MGFGGNFSLSDLFCCHSVIDGANVPLMPLCSSRAAAGEGKDKWATAEVNVLLIFLNPKGNYTHILTKKKYLILRYNLVLLGAFGPHLLHNSSLAC